MFFVKPYDDFQDPEIFLWFQVSDDNDDDDDELFSLNG